MTDEIEITAAFDSSQSILGGLQPLRGAIRQMLDCIGRMDQRVDQFEARLTALGIRESSTVIRMANKQQPPDSLKKASGEELEGLMRLVKELGELQSKVEGIVTSFAK
ncbi:hypothetical protein F4678DRAFT_457164 [Xylaria arbuscula]|nr:hypothetical protein F4678DRAFT_457164 [Xylaria arbuscula]